jgi:hypothetical protein
MCPGVDSASKNEYQEISWVRKGDDLTTFIVQKVKKIRSLNFPDPQGPARPVEGNFYIFFMAGRLAGWTTESLDKYQVI